VCLVDVSFSTYIYRKKIVQKKQLTRRMLHLRMLFKANLGGSLPRNDVPSLMSHSQLIFTGKKLFRKNSQKEEWCTQGCCSKAATLWFKPAT
jgi:hypothetical protein